MRVGEPIGKVSIKSDIEIMYNNIFPSPGVMDEEYVPILNSQCYISASFTSNGLKARLLVPRDAAIDDLVVALDGCSCLLLLHPCPHPQSPRYYSLVGAVAAITTGYFALDKLGALFLENKAKKEIFVLRRITSLYTINTNEMKEDLAGSDNVPF